MADDVFSILFSLSTPNLIETTLLAVHCYTLKAVGEHKVTALCLLDLSAAFDTINHEILIRKVHVFCHLSHNVIKWIVSFLSGRTQAVSSDGKLSCWLPIT